MKVIKGKAEDVKACRACGRCVVGWRDILALFAKDPTRSDGLSVYCKQCKAEYARLRYKFRKVQQ